MTQKYHTSSTDDHGHDDNIFWKYLKTKRLFPCWPVSSSLVSLSQRTNQNRAIEEITCKVVGTNVLTRYNIKMDRIDDIEWKTFLKANRYSDLNW